MSRRVHDPEIKPYTKIEDTLLYKFAKSASFSYVTPKGGCGMRPGDCYFSLDSIEVLESKIILHCPLSGFSIQLDKVNTIEEHSYPIEKIAGAATIFKGVKGVYFINSKYVNDDRIIYEDNKGFDLVINWGSNEVRKFLCWPEQKYQYTGTLQSFSETLFMKYLSDMWLGVCTPKGWSDKKGKLPYTGIKVRIEDDVVKIINWYHFEIQIIGATTFKEEIDSTQDQQKLIFYDVKKVAMYDLEKKIRVKSPYYEDLKGFTLILFWSSPEYKNNFYRPTE